MADSVPGPLAPEVRDLLEWDARLGLRVDGCSVVEARRIIRSELDELVVRLGAAVAQDISVRDHDVPVDGARIRLRVYTPPGEGLYGAFFHVHGGGFTLGGADWTVNHVKCAHIAASAGCVVTTVDYRLAPEHPYPAAPDDCYSALLWLVDHAGSLGVDAARIAVGGESAGGNLAAVLALMARDLDGPALTLQLLEVPVTDMSEGRAGYPSVSLFGNGYGLDATAIDAFTESYLPEPGDRARAYASPLLAPDLTGVAPAHVVTAELDPLRDSGEAYARRLAAAGVPTSLRRFDGHTHGSSVLWPAWAPAAEWMDDVVAAVRAATSAPAR